METWTKKITAELNDAKLTDTEYRFILQIINCLVKQFKEDKEECQLIQSKAMKE